MLLVSIFGNVLIFSFCKVVILFFLLNHGQNQDRCIQFFFHYHFRSLPAFVWHRQNWDIAYPYVELDSTELEDLSQKHSFVAGFTDASIEGR